MVGLSLEVVFPIGGLKLGALGAGRTSAALRCVFVVLTGLPAAPFQPPPQPPSPPTAAECISLTNWPGIGRELVFLPAAVTGQCSCLLFTATHSHSPPA